MRHLAAAAVLLLESVAFVMKLKVSSQGDKDLRDSGKGQVSST